MSASGGGTATRDCTRVRAVEAISVQLPVRREWLWRGLGEPLGRWVIVRVHTDSGLIGLGEATPLPDWGGDSGRYYGETPQTVMPIVTEYLAPAIVGLDPWDVERALQRMDARVKGHPYAKAAVEMALHDLRGKLADVPLYQLLGGATRDGVQIAHMLGIMPAEEAAREAAAAMAEGITAFQIKGTGDYRRDAEVIRRVREIVGSDVMLRLDANQGYPEPKLAVKAVEEFRLAGADLIEQPTEGVRQMTTVRAQSGVRIMADESCWRAEDAAEIGALAAADAISIYIAKAGGITPAQRVAAVAAAYGLPCDVNGSLESGIGNAANVHFAVATPAVSLASVIPVSAPKGTGCEVAGRYYTDDLVVEPFPYRDGFVLPPPGPGLGVQLDEDKLRAYTVD